MDKETAVEIERLKGRVSILEEAYKEWSALIRKTIIKVVKWLLGMGLSGLLFGLHLPENVRKAISEWIYK